MSASSVGSASCTNCQNCMVDTLLFEKETLFCPTFRLACALPTAKSEQSIFSSHTLLFMHNNE